jgi:hypothetical protein
MMSPREQKAREFRDNKREKVTNMKKNTKTSLVMISLALLVFTFNSCKSDVVETPAPLGPSTIAVILDLSASPNVIFATQKERQTVEVTASLKRYDGTPVSDRTVFFEIIDSSGGILDLGYFDQNVSVQNVVTDGDGTARTIYHGPLKRELTHDRHVYIRGTVAWEGSQFIIDKTTIWVVLDTD